MDTPPLFSRIAVCGVGLLGGSIGLALRRAGFAGRIVGLGRRAESIDAALNFGTIDEGTLEPAEALSGSDLAILATPVGTFPKLLQQCERHLPPAAVITDVGSTKQQVVDWAADALADPSRFVGAHPIAGSDRRGPQYARADLFDSACCILTPTRKTDPGTADAAEAFWRSLGMWTVRMTPARHDAALAKVSHLPHVLASCLMRTAGRTDQDLSGPGFLDVTRIAGGDPAMWRDILLTNRKQVMAAIEALDGELQTLRGLLESEDGPAIQRFLAAAQRRRRDMVDRKMQRDLLEG